MHELSIARSVLEAVQRHLPPGRPLSVRTVRVRLGEEAGIAPESLTFCFDLVSRGTPAEGAALEIERVAGGELRVFELETKDED